MLLDQNFLVSLILINDTIIKLAILNHFLMKTIILIFLDIKISFYAFKLLIKILEKFKIASKLGTC